MSLNHRLEGGKVSLVGTCALVDEQTQAETPTDPATVTYSRRTPDGALHTYVWPGAAEIEHLGTGVFVCRVVVTIVGREKWRFETSGAVIAVAEHAFDVLQSAVLA